ncbi:MAG TPA: WD40 repeat domain-containing protein, partial [Pirellulaceae bacterium]|nr:WD40 repeat domain-containing protein [Pirellulaceae bacterium]
MSSTQSAARDSKSPEGATPTPANTELFTLRGGENADYFVGMSALRLSPDGKTLAVTDDSQVRLLDPQTGEIQRTLSGPIDFCKALAFTPDGRGLAVGALQSGVTLFDVSNGSVIRQFKAGELETVEVAISPDGKRLAVGAGDSRGADWSQLRVGEIRVWDLESGKEIALCDGVDCLVTALTFTPDGKRIVAGLKNGELAEWSTENWRRARTLREHRGAVNDVVFLRDGRRLASVGEDAVIRVWNWPIGAVVETLKGHEGPIAAVAASPWEDLLATAGRDRSIRVWDLESGASHATLNDFQWSLQAAGFSDSGRTFFAADYSSAQIYDSATLRRIASIPFGHWTYTAAMSPDGARIASGGNQGESGEPPATVKLWQIDGAKVVREFEPRLDTVTLVRFSPDGQLLAARGKLEETPHVVLWDVASGRELQRWENTPCFDFSLDNRLVAVGGPDGLFVWQRDSREQSKVRDSATSEVRFTNDSTLLWIMTPSGVLRHVDLNGVTGVAAMPNVVGFTISSDRRWLCPTQSSGASILNAVTTMPHATLAATTGATRSTKLFSPDNRTLAEIGDVVRLWHVETGEPLLELDGYGLPVHVAAFSPDSQLLIIGGGSRDENNGLWVFRAPRDAS